MYIKRKGWQRGFLCLLAMLFIASPAFVLEGQTVTPYPYDQVHVVIGFSGVYDLLTIHKFWARDWNNPETEDAYYKLTLPSSQLTEWLDKIAANGGNVIRFFSHGNWQAAPKDIPITPWQRRDSDDTYNCNPQSNAEWNSFYWKRLDNLMKELQKRNLTAWIDIWDFCSLKDSKFEKHPFFKNNNGESWPEDPNTGLNKFFSCGTSVVKIWRQKLEAKLVGMTRVYNPIYSTNEVPDTYLDFLVSLTNFLNSTPQSVAMGRISHSPEVNSNLNDSFPGQLLLSVHNRSVASEIVPSFFNKGFRVISSDGENRGSIERSSVWHTKKPLSALEAYNSMRAALKYGYCGLEVFDRDEYMFGYEEANVDLGNIDRLNISGNENDSQYPPLYTLQRMVIAYLENVVTVSIPNGGQSWQKGTTKNITWSGPNYKWGMIRISLYNNGARVGTIAEVDSTRNSYTWTVGNYIGGSVSTGSKYQIQVKRISGEGVATVLYDFTNGYFGINDITIPTKVTLISPSNGSIQSGPSVQFTWNQATPQVDKYELQVYKNNSLYTPVPQPTSTSYTITSNSFFSKGNTYTWKVRAHNSKGWGPWSDTRTFYTPMPYLLLKYPGDGDEVYDPFVTLKWYPITGTNPAVTKYHLQTWNNGRKDIDNANIPASQTSYEVGPLGNGRPYTWRVRAYNGKFWGEWSQTWRVTYRIIY